MSDFRYWVFKDRDSDIGRRIVTSTVLNTRNPRPETLRLIPLLLLTVVIAACGTGGDPTLLPDDTGPPPTVEGLQARATEATQALNDGRWLDFYEFKSERSVAPRLPYALPVAQLCTKEQFIFDVGTKLAKLRALGGFDGEEVLTWKITDLSHDKRFGIVVLDIFHEDQLVTDQFHDYLGEFADGARWVYIEGEWWVEPEDWNKGCHQDRPFGG